MLFLLVLRVFPRYFLRFTICSELGGTPSGFSPDSAGPPDEPTTIRPIMPIILWGNAVVIIRPFGLEGDIAKTTYLAKCPGVPSWSLLWYSSFEGIGILRTIGSGGDGVRDEFFRPYQRPKPTKCCEFSCLDKLVVILCFPWRALLT